MKDLISRLTWVDYLALFACVRGFYVGYKSGFFPELLRTVSYILSVIVAFRFYDWLAQWLTAKTFFNSMTAAIVSFITILAVAYFSTGALKALLLKMLKVGDGGPLGRFAGLLLGACRWIILLSLVFILIDRSPLTQLKADIHTRSLTGPVISRTAPALLDFLSRVSPQLSVPKDKEKETA